MHRTVFKLSALAALATFSFAACSSDDPEPTEPNPPGQTAAVTASATANVFSPSTQQVARGGTVTWSFGARPHNVTFASTAGAPANIATSTSTQESRQFDTAGTFPYECTVHPGMSGTIVVE